MKTDNRCKAALTGLFSALIVTTLPAVLVSTGTTTTGIVSRHGH